MPTAECIIGKQEVTLKNGVKSCWNYTKHKCFMKLCSSRRPSIENFSINWLFSFLKFKNNTKN